jgi:DtxR family Mn-dependent transcriptional regulator
VSVPERERQVEEILERLWTAREQDAALAPDLAGEPLGFSPAAALAEAARRGWTAVRDGRLEITRAGETRAAQVIRRHRLAERLLCDVIGVDQTAMETVACQLEHTHILSAAATDRVCAFLGHPPTCPHDRPIPRGRCCEVLTREVEPLVTPLAAGAVGGDYRVVFVASRSHRRLERLCALGIVPGANLRLQQRAPAFVVRAGETEVALEPEIAHDIFVVPR